MGAFFIFNNMANKFKCEIVTLDRIYKLCMDLSMKIRESGYQVDQIIAIARGGFVPARLLCDFLDINDLTCIKVKHYEATDKGENARLQYPVNSDIKGKNILLVDDVNDTGKSIVVALEHLKEHQPKEIKVAVMHEKKGSLVESDYFVDFLEDWRWLIYEWAVVEDVGSFIKNSTCTTTDEILTMLKEDYGISMNSDYLNKLMRFLK